MMLKTKNVSRIKMLSVALFVASMFLGAMPIKYTFRTHCFTGPTEHYYITIYTVIPPKSYPSGAIKQLPQAMTPIKDIAYGFIFGSIFLLFGYFNIKMRWVFHVITGGLGLFVSFIILLFNPGDTYFLPAKLLLCVTSILSIIVGIEIVKLGYGRKKEKEDNKENPLDSATASPGDL